MPAFHPPERLRLTFPGQLLDPEKFRALYEEFKTTHPDAFAEWREIEDRSDWPEADDLKESQDTIIEFLRTRVDWEDRTGLGMGFTAFRTLIHRK